jgi:hypothetical protein
MFCKKDKIYQWIIQERSLACQDKKHTGDQAQQTQQVWRIKLALSPGIQTRRTGFLKRTYTMHTSQKTYCCCGLRVLGLLCELLSAAKWRSCCGSYKLCAWAAS